MHFQPDGTTVYLPLYVCCKQTSVFLGVEKVDQSTSSLPLLTCAKTLIPVSVNDSVPTENDDDHAFI